MYPPSSHKIKNGGIKAAVDFFHSTKTFDLLIPQSLKFLLPAKMPLHRIYHTPGQFTNEQKKGLAAAITEIYTSSKGPQLPAFYVVVLFVPIEEQDFFVGGETTKNFVRITVQHIARHFENKEQANGFLDYYEGALAPFIKEQGFDWEVRRLKI